MRQRVRLLALAVLFASLLSFTALGTALASTGSAGVRTAQANVHSSDPSLQSPCFVRIVYLHGQNPATSQCKVAKKPAHPIPQFASYPCGDQLPYPWVSLYQNSWYGGAQICFVGLGSGNLTNFWINGHTSWNDQTSSFNMGAYGNMSSDINGNGNHCYFSPGAETYYINNYCGGGWNDVVSYVNISG
ncbi:MAG TPA: hypothetical protein VJ761_00405 [Ktedonobacteraceae bacterium]|nr:hypothetical protein [Ktedonobacteraceae bacterium]